MSLRVVPINMINSPNYWSPTKETYWPITANTAVNLWGELTIVDSLGTRPYVPALGAILQASFQRGDFIGSLTNQSLSVLKTALLDTNFRALFQLQLAATEATNIISGSVVFTLTEGTNVQTWSQHFMAKKFNVSAGC